MTPVPQTTVRLRRANYMATKAANPTKTEADSKPEAQTEAPDGPLLDLSDAAVKKLIKTAKKRCYVTYEEINAVVPSEEVTSEQIEDIMAMFSDMGINVVDEDEVEEAEADNSTDEEGGELATTSSSTAVASTSNAKSGSDRTDDPVRMYLREMGSVELLSREGEIAIAKRIEAGRETMIAGLCESPLTFQAIIIWRDELNEGKILLRDIIDLDATFAGPDAKKVDHSQAALAGEAPPRVEPEEEEVDEDGEDDNSMSLAAMEAELKPKVLETFDTIASDYKKLRKLQDLKVELALKGEELPSAQEKKYQKLTSDLIEEVKSLSLNNNRIESLVEQLYAINKRLMGLEGRLLRLAESHGVPREEFLKQYFGNELDPNWPRRVSRLKGKGWTDFCKDERDQVKELRQEIQTLASETGLDISEYRRIVATMQKGEREARIAKK